MSHIKLWSSQYPVQDPGSEEFISCKKLKIAKEDLLPRCAVQTWVFCLTGHDILLITWEPQLKRGICSCTSCVVTRSCSKAASDLPLEFLLKASCYITWRIGRVRTNTIPLDRREPPDHLGTWSRLNHSCLLIGLRPQNHLGSWSCLNQCNTFW